MRTKILLADDDPMIREMLQIVLTKFEFEVTTAENGKQVVEILKTNPRFELIILDINMPELNGIETAKQIRSSKNPLIKNIPIIAMTGYQEENEINSIINSGINNYIAKPAKPAALIEIIENSLGNSSGFNKEIKKQNFENSSDKSVFDVYEQDEIDIKKGITYLGDNFNIFKKLLIKFYKNYTGYVDKMKVLIENKKYKDLEFTLHKLKGVSAQICAIKLNKETIEFENLINKNPDLISLESIASLEKHFIKTMEVIEKIFQPEPKRQIEESPEIFKQADPMAIKNNLLRLATYLKQKKTNDAETIIYELTRSELNENHLKVLKEIKFFTENNDLDAAFLKVKKFLNLL